MAHGTAGDASASLTLARTAASASACLLAITACLSGPTERAGGGPGPA